jgi:type IV secretory pathway VirD2 relaxase
MTDDVTCDFRLEPGFVSDCGGTNPQIRLFANQVKVAVTKAGGIHDGRIQIRRADNTVRSRPRKGRCCRIGRGQAAADRLKFMAEMRSDGDRARRVVVKGRIVRLSLHSQAAGKHLRYLQRDGTSRDGERGQLYGAETEEADGKAFVKRGRQDRHQFRFIVAAEDGDRLSDLRAFTRDVMQQMEKDLGAKLDWVAADHFNTGHPHSHVIVRGHDDGKDLIIAQDYLSYGIRLRAQELVTLELGPETEREWRRKLRAEVSAERFTRIDRALIARAQVRMLDLRPQAGQVRTDFDETVRIGRLKVLARYGLAEETEPGIWNLSEDLEPTMRALGERSDIVRALNRALGVRGQQRGLESYDLDGQENSIVGRLIDKRTTDAFGGSIGLVIDGIDGRLHHVKLPLAAEELPVGAIVEVGRETSQHRADRNIAQIAGDAGEYRPSAHRAHVEAADTRTPDGDYDAFVGAHVQRLEALHRAGIVTRLDADRWKIPSDFEDRAAVYDAAVGSQARVRILSVYDLDRQITSDGATWLDRELVRRNQNTLSTSGFGAEVKEALEQRKGELVRQGHVRRMLEGRAFVRSDLLEALQRQEVARIGCELAAQRGRAFHAIRDGQTVCGTLVGSAQLASGRFAMIDDGLGLSLVPWRPVIENKIGRQVMGVMCAGEMTWKFGRGRGLGFGP